MNSSNPKSIDRVGTHGRRIIDDVRRMRIVTNETVRKRWIPELTANAVAKTTSKLVADGWLCAYPLIGRRKYFTPGPRTVNTLSLSQSASKPLGSQALPTWVAVSSYIAMSGPVTRVSLPSELKASFPWMPGYLMVGPHVMKTLTDKIELRLIRVDLGGSVKHIASKCEEDLRRRVSFPQFQSMLETKTFVFVVLTTTEQKKKFLMKELSNRRWPQGVRFELCVVPDLYHVLGVQ